MTFKKSLISVKAQSALEYIMVFVVIAAGALAAFISFSPNDVRDVNNVVITPATRMKNVFVEAITQAVNEINKDE